MKKQIIGLTDNGKKKLRDHLDRAKQTGVMPLDDALSDLIEVVTPQINNPNPKLSAAPWHFAIGIAGTTYPKSFEEHETSDYEEVCLCYHDEDLLVEDMTLEAWEDWRAELGRELGEKIIASDGWGECFAAGLTPKEAIACRSHGDRRDEVMDFCDVPDLVFGLTSTN